MAARIHPRDVAALTALLLLGIGVPLVLAAMAGAIGIPSTDDWVYIRGGASLSHTGAVAMPDHTTASIGQLVMVQPLLWLSGGNTWAFTAFGLVMAAVGLASAYLLARRFVGIGSAAMVVLSLEAFPGFARESAAFMTDVPTFALITLSLFLATRWLRGGGRLTLVASLLVGVMAVSIREFAIAAPAAILVVAWARSQPEERRWLAWASAATAALAAGVLVMAGTLAGRGVPLAPQPLYLDNLAPAFVTLAAVLLPVTLLGVARRLPALRPEHVMAGAALIILVFSLPTIQPLVGQLWTPDGLVGNALLMGTREPVIGQFAWRLSEQLALLAAILLATLVLRWAQRALAQARSVSTALAWTSRLARSREGLLVVFLVGYAVELVVVTAVTYPQDRYLYPMVAPIAILLLRGPAQHIRLGRRHALSHAALAWLAVSAFVIVTNAVAYDGARWRAGEAAVAMGYAPQAVDAGYEWVGYHASGVGNARWADYGLTWYDDAFLARRPCAVLSNSPLEVSGFTLIYVDRSAYRQYLFFGPEEPLYLYGSTASGCPTPPRTIAARKPLARSAYTAVFSPGAGTGARGSGEGSKS